MNERNTENLVRDMLRNKGYYDDQSIKIEEQKSDTHRINKLLKNASKSAIGKGYPDFIISFTNKPDEIIVIECKADISKHESKEGNKYKDYAVDGVLQYADYLKKEYTVTAIAISGQNEKEKKISNFIWLKDHINYISIPDERFLNPKEIAKIISEKSEPITEKDLIEKAIEYNSLLHQYAIPEAERCTLISTILVALQDTPFRNSYKDYEHTDNKNLLEHMIKSCSNILEKNDDLDKEKINTIINQYKQCQNNKLFISKIIKNKKSKEQENNTILRDLITKIKDEIFPYINTNQFDMLGKFYTGFIRYAGGDKKTGLVLTPSHITDLFCDIANLTEDAIVFDPCCGTGGFLVSSMNYMLDKAGYNSTKHKQIKSNQLLGIEQRADMFTHACSNMMMRGDGKSNIYHGDCFDEELKNKIKNKKPTVSLLNPPYQDGNACEQLEFIENALECIEKSGICVAICQMSTVVGSDTKINPIKERLLNNHTLKATFSMPNDLFHPVGVITCILVFEAHNPHPKNKETFFGYFKNDGFEKRKNKGRLDVNNMWQSIKSKWLETYTNNKSKAGLSITKNINFEDEWCAEAYMETDYSTLSDDDFIKNIKEYVAFQFLNEDK